MENLSGMLIPIGTILLVFLLQISFWFPTEAKGQQPSVVSQNRRTTPNSKAEGRRSVDESSSKRPTVSKRIQVSAQDSSAENDFLCMVIQKKNIGSESEPPPTMSNNETSSSPTIQEGRMWKCACEFGILPAGIFKTFGNAEAMMRLGVGQCYHKK